MVVYHCMLQIESRMETLHCLVMWPECGSDSVLLRSSVPFGGGVGGGGDALGTDWAERCGNALRNELDRYKAGTDSYLNVITTQQIALSDQQTAVTILQRRMTAAVDLVKALGGGWDASTLPSGDAIRSVAMAKAADTVKVAQPASK